MNTITNRLLAALFLALEANSPGAETAQSAGTAPASFPPDYQLAVANNAVSFQTPAVQFQSGPPAVELLAGKEVVQLTPQGEASVSQETPQTPAGPALAQTWKWTDPRGYAFTWTITRLPQWSGFTVKMTFANQSKETVRLRKFLLSSQQSAALQVAGAPADWFLSTLDSHDSTGGGFHPSGDLKTNGRRNFLDTLTLFTGRGRTGLILGAAGPAESDIRYFCDIREGRIGLRIDSEMNDILVDPGETRRSEEMLILAAPYESGLTHLFQWMAVTHGARTQRGSVFGWCSWYTKYTQINENNLESALTALVSQRYRLPMQVFQIDDGWQKCYGDWTAEPKKFPNGMKPIAEKITAAGMIPGIWMTLVTSSTNGVHPDGNQDNHLDPTYPGTREFIRQTLRARYAEGYRYFKLDFNWPRWKDRFNQKLTRLQVQRDMFKQYREAIGEDSYLCACVGGFHRGAIGYADSLRIGTDSGPRWFPMYTGCCMADLFNSIGSMSLAHGILFAADPDVTYTVPEKYKSQGVGPGKTQNVPFLPDAVRAWHGYVGLLGGVIMTSDSFDQAPWNNAAAVRMMEILWPAAPEHGRAFDGQTDPWHRQFGLTAARPWGRFVSTMLYNPREETADLPINGVPTDSLGQRFHVWSFWDEKYLGIQDNRFTASGVPAAGGLLLRLTELAKTPDVPVLIGSNLHISMGAAEIQTLITQANRLKIELTDAGARAGALFFHSAQPLAPIKSAGCTIKSVTLMEPQVWRVEITGRQHGQAQSLELRVGR